MLSTSGDTHLGGDDFDKVGTTTLNDCKFEAFLRLLVYRILLDGFVDRYRELWIG